MKRTNIISVNTELERQNYQIVSQLLSSANKNKYCMNLQAIYELGGSILKHVKGYEMSTKFENSKVNVKDFPGANVKVFLHDNPDHILFRVGTNE